MPPAIAVLLAAIALIVAGCGSDAKSSKSSGTKAAGAKCSPSPDSAFGFTTLDEYTKGAGSDAIKLPALDELGMGAGVTLVAGLAGAGFDGKCDTARTVSSPYTIKDPKIKGLAMVFTCTDSGKLPLTAEAPAAAGGSSKAPLDDADLCPSETGYGPVETLTNFAGVGPGDGSLTVKVGADTPKNFVVLLVSRPS